MLPEVCVICEHSQRSHNGLSSVGLDYDAFACTECPCIFRRYHKQPNGHELIKVEHDPTGKLATGVEIQIHEFGKILKQDMVNHPSHYGGDTTYEAIKVIEAWDLNFNLGNVLKYICRLDKKGDIENLEKARFYIEREIKRRTPMLYDGSAK